MKVARSEEQERVWFRSERVFLSGGSEWYFQTREGVDLGPYDTQFEAEVEAGLLKELLLNCGDEAAIGITIQEFVSDSFDMGRPLSPRYQSGHAAS